MYSASCAIFSRKKLISCHFKIETHSTVNFIQKQISIKDFKINGFCSSLKDSTINLKRSQFGYQTLSSQIKVGQEMYIVYAIFGELHKKLTLILQQFTHPDNN